ncbi:response regulator [Actinacidiphila bryophytorum]|uniref:Two component transcriptional regulator, LuxR family n=1 Tax=Actinacidiphila bryophytorum TaxID=1436133 RepID=A0A9W4ED99_9ACTN|nr:response regulator transcription factor [Actinacidiphila bryophytorum]MBM9434376.1 response regulator transcription factor [Actinacidiphila bryophytorum]MBN6543589.1 response regulator transcription factor [Actinacidiphila bryophytorum]CAG7625361.1 Two component transcriptional regulator, LuxR family [Actinacidiphila bryophytorum]
MVQVAIVDDEALVRAALRSILESSGDIRVVADCDGHQALAAVSAARPDLVLLDAVMPGPDDGLSVLRALRALQDPPAVAMLTAFDTSAHLRAAMAAGASGFLLKDTAVGTLIDAVRILAAGGTVFTPTVGRAVVDGYLGEGPADAAPDAVTGARDAAIATLTDRERSVLRLLAAGEPNAAIADELRISVGTVKDHVRSVLRKLGAPNRVAAAVVAHQTGLARLPERP